MFNIHNESVINKEKIPNLKEFIKYLNQTLDMFDQHVPSEEFERKDSDIHKLFVSLFNLYTDIDSKKENSNNTDPVFFDKNIVAGLINTNHNVNPNNNINPKSNIGSVGRKIKIPKDNFKWENNKSINSEKLAREIYKKTLNDLKTLDNEPIITSSENKNIQLNLKKINMYNTSDNVYNDPSSPTPVIPFAKKSYSKPKKIYVDHYSSSHTYDQSSQYKPKTKKLETKKFRNRSQRESTDSFSTKYYNYYPIETAIKEKNPLFSPNKNTRDNNNYDIYTTDSKNDSDLSNILDNESCENTEDIDKKIRKLKELLKK